MTVRRLAFLSWLLLAPPAHAHELVDEQAYRRAVNLVDRLFLHPDTLEAQDLLESAALRLAREVHWLLVETDGSAIYLHHGDGTPIGSVSVASMDTLPSALQSLERVVVDAGYELDGVDVRLEVLQGMMFALDRYSRVLAGDRLERFQVRLSGTLVGVGAHLHSKDGDLTIRRVVPDGPAEQAGLQADDHITRIDGLSTTNMPLSEATRRIRGELGTQVVLTIERDEEPLEVAIERDEVVVPNLRHEVLDGGVGYIRIDHFSQRTVENLHISLDALREEGALDRGLVLDLRRNTGGSMQEAARSADVFLRRGMLLRTVGRDGREVESLRHRLDASPPAMTDVPLVVLVDDRTASGSEILAGTLLELGRAVIVGAPTYGKGTVQRIYPLQEQIRLKLTVAQYILANDRAIADGGIVPDTVLATIRLDEHGARYLGWNHARADTDWDHILPVVRETEAWRDDAVEDPDLDVARDLARRTVLAAPGPTRRETLDALQRISTQVRDEQEARLVEALAARHVDWSPAPEPMGDIEASARVYTVPDPEDPDRLQVEAQIQNHGDAPLHRAMVELKSSTFRAWNGLVIPIGHVAPRGRAMGRVAIPLRPGLALREDQVQVRLRADGRPSTWLDEEILQARSSDLPRLTAEVRLMGEGPEHVAKVQLQNHADLDLEDVYLSFQAPDEPDVELVDAESRLSPLPAGMDATFGLGIRILERSAPTLDLKLSVESEHNRRPLAEWPVEIPLDGTSLALDPPRIHFRGVVQSAPVGPPLPLELTAIDTEAVDHVMLWVNGAKVAWAGGSGPVVELRTELDLQPGANRVRAVARDAQGLETVRSFVIRGEAAAAADAATEDNDDELERPGQPSGNQP